MRSLVCFALVCVSACNTNIQQHAAFGRAPVMPDPVEARVGDVVPFEVRPPVKSGSYWSLECHGRARFAEDRKASSLDWYADVTPIHMEAVVSPWDPPPGGTRATSHRWLDYGLREHGESESLDRDLPVHRVDYKELAPVTFSSAFSVATPTQKLSFQVREGRVFVTYLTPVEAGTPIAPAIDTMLLETAGRTVLYAEVRTNFGQVPKEQVGYAVTLSYEARAVQGPVDAVVVEWVAHDAFQSPFSVERLTIDAAAPVAVAAPGPA
jgi:hypothetical protein